VEHLYSWREYKLLRMSIWLFRLGCFYFLANKLKGSIDIFHELVLWHYLTHLTYRNEALASVLVCIFILLSWWCNEVKYVIDSLIKLLVGEVIVV